MEKTAFIDRTGGPEVIQWRDETCPRPHWARCGCATMRSG